MSPPSLSLGSKRSAAIDGSAPQNEDNSAPPRLRGRRVLPWYRRALQTAEVKGVVALVVLALGLPLLLYWLLYAIKVPPPDTIGTCSLSSAYRVWCLPGQNTTRAQCESAGCCWDGGSCFHPLPAEHGYRASAWRDPQAALDAALSAAGLPLTARRHRSPFGSASRPLRLFVRPRDADSLAVLLSGDAVDVPVSNVSLSDCALGIELEGPVLGFTVYRRDDNSSLLASVDTALIYTDSYRELSVTTTGDVELVAGALLPRSSASSRLLYAGPGHPMALPSAWLLDKKGRAAVFMLEELDGPIEAWHTFGSSVLTLRGAVAGTWSLRIGAGPTPADAVQQIRATLPATATTVPPTLPPLWALGLHFCPHASDMQKALDLMASLQDFPWDSTCLWDSILGLSLGNETAQPLQDIAPFLNSSLLTGRKVVVSIPSAACMNCSVPETGLVHSENGSQIYSGLYMGEEVVYPDWTMEEARQWFRSEVLQKLEPLRDEGLLGGVVLHNNWPLDETEHPYEEVDYFPEGLPLSEGTLWWQAKHSGGQVSHHKVHATLPVLEASTFLDLPLVLSDAAVPGVFGSTLPFKPNEDKNETVLWSELQGAIEDIQMAGLGGVPFSAPPLCAGSAELPVDGELCLRWVQAASLMPFVVINRDLLNATLGNNNTLSIMQSAIEMRYRLMPYLYSYLADSVESGLPLIRPSWFHDPDVAILQKMGRSDQFWVGSALLVAPVVKPSTYTVSVRLPKANFFHLLGDGKRISGNGSAITMQSLKAETVLLLREGHVIPMQIAASTAEETRQTNVTLVAALSCRNDSTWNCSAEGKMRVLNSLDSSSDPWIYFLVTTQRQIDEVIVEVTLTNLVGAQGMTCMDDAFIIDTIRVMGFPESGRPPFVKRGLAIDRCTSMEDSLTLSFSFTISSSVW
ncbi:uncharacterized protein LOC126199272 [Schistocerca nitens]|uniref:uncharacterized protein LOC126199272 n=1 Tax=Schistocerca nitens TaxID=7011 RepID=UPI002117F96B|nr:uncharacterized protein LOC126199272 [Schistocerca nitens]